MTTPRTIPLARTYPREHTSGEPGTWFTEYRLACPTMRARDAIYKKFGATESKPLFGALAPTMVTRQRIDISPDGRRRGSKPDVWFAPTPNKAVTEVGDSSFTGLSWARDGSAVPTGEVESLHPAHREFQGCIMQRADAAKLMNAAAGWLKRDKYGGRTPLEDKYQGEFTAALKKAKLWSKAQKGLAPPEKVAVIQSGIRAAYEQEKAHWTHEAEIWRVGAEMDCTPKFDFGDFCRR